MEILDLKYNRKVKYRVDEYLSSLDSIHSRSHASKLIKGGNLKVNGILVQKTSHKLKKGDQLQVRVDDAVTSYNIEPEQVPFQILFENKNIIVIDKPAGVVVHPGPGNPKGTLVSGIVKHLGMAPEGLDSKRPGIVHRLDKDTSGIMVVAKNLESLIYYSNLFKTHKIQKKYKALIYGKLSQNSGMVTKYIGRHRKDRKKMTVVEPSRGKYSKTHYSVIDYYHLPEDDNLPLTLVDLTLETGRTHQIRVHLKHLGYPVVGDTVYAGNKLRAQYPKATRQLLHAFSIKFVDMYGKQRYIETPIPNDFKEYLSLLTKYNEE